MSKKILYLIKKNFHYLPFLGLHFLREHFFQKLFAKIGFSFFPSLITILITKRCNYKCKGCSSSSPNYTQSFFNNNNKEMTFDEIKLIINQVAWFKPFIYLNGGEPTLRKDLIEIIKYIKEKHLVCALTTNASLLDEKLIRGLVEVELDFLSVSIDGPEKFHDNVRGVPGAYKKAISGIKILTELKNKNKVNYPHIRLASIIYPENMENSEYIVDLANDLRVDEIGFGLLMYYPENILREQRKFISKYDTGGCEPIGLEIKNNQKFNFSENKYLDFLNYARNKSKIPIYFAYKGKQFTEYFDTEIFPNQKSKCFTPWNSLLIQPNGDLGICQGFVFGNAFKGNILKQWNNKKIRNFRKLRAKTPFPACFRCNEGQKLILNNTL